ncbi:MAG TPA: DUF3472 domain-containing protein [Armatimonadota bacterium]
MALGLARTAQADESLAGIACRSVHLQYQAPEGDAFINEVVVRRSAPGTYFCVCGFSAGYFGVQELEADRKLLIFSVWDPGGQNDPSSVAEDRRVQLLYKDPKVRTGRFGGEGTGGQSFLDYRWKVGETLRLMVSAEVQGERTAYTGWFQESGKWRKLATFSTPSGGKRLSGYYSFVEDFLRNRVSASQERRAEYGPAQVRGLDGRWTPVSTARFTADSNPATNIDAGVKGSRFFLATGGGTRNSHVPLHGTAVAPAPSPRPPRDLPAELKSTRDR